MREIKFRAWNKHHKIMGEIYMIDTLHEIVMIETKEKTTHTFGTSTVELMQYTGLLDKHGVEIYEGDIIKADNGNSFRIVFFDGAFQVARPQKRMKIVMSLMLPCRNKDIEVIGNIYENEEFLNY